MSQEQESCVTCRFWKAPLKSELGSCCFNPPKVIDCIVDRSMSRDKGFDMQHFESATSCTFFPVTYEWEWCGKWERKG